MTHPGSFAWTLAIAFAAGGIALGSCYFIMLRRSLAGRGMRTLILTLARLGAAAGFFCLAVRFGAVPLLAGLLGFLVARFLALRAPREAS
jgi:N-ATPase, AtpR subunit